MTNIKIASSSLLEREMHIKITIKHYYTLPEELQFLVSIFDNHVEQL